MKLIDLLNEANEVYPDGFLADYYDEVTGEPTNWHSGDILAWFIVNELADAFKEYPDEPVMRGQMALSRASQQLDEIVNRLSK